MAFLTHNHLRLTRRTVSLSRLPGSFEGFQWVHLSDLHFYEHTDAAYYDRVVRLVNDLKPDAVAVTGDIIHFRAEYMAQAASFLRQIRAEHKFAILGNHDFHDNANGKQIGTMLRDCGYTFLRNGHAFLERSLDGSPDNSGERLYVAGLDDLWYGAPDIVQALDGIPNHQATVLLAHNPLLFDPVATVFADRVDLVLSGHTHAGHVYFPLLKPIYRAIFRMKYRYGMFEKNGCQLHVTSGLGSAAFYLKRRKIGFPRFRLNTHPEVALLTLQRR